MKRTTRRGTAVLAVGVSAALVLAACGGGDDDSSSGSSGVFDQGSKQIVNPSDKKGGQLHMLRTGDFDSTDPGNMYYATAWNFSRLYARSLLTFKSVGGQGNLEIAPDLATGLGQSSKDLKTWTYKLRPGIKFSDGTPVTAKDVKYAVARSNYSPEVMEKGPVYFRQYLYNPNKYKGVYKDSNLDNFKGVTTPDDNTVVFHLAQPFAEFDYLATIPQTAPVPKAADTGANGGVNYAKHVVSTGPYKLDSYEPGKSIKLSKNPNWDTSDSNRKQLLDGIDVQLGVAPDEVDNRQIDGSADMDVQGNGVNAAARSQILTDSAKKGNADNPKSGFLWYTAISRQVPPFDNKECRIAVQYAVDKTGYQNAYGGTTGGDIAHTVLPPSNPGYKDYGNLYQTPGDKGDVTKAKEHLAKCGKPQGFTTNISYRTERPKEKAAAESVKAALAKVGITVNIKNFPEDGYTGGVVGDPKFVTKNQLGLMIYGWAADFPSGFGFLQQITDPGALKGTGSSNISHIDLPDIAKKFKDVVSIKDEAGRNAVYQQIDQAVMEDASIIPMLYAKNLYYRNPKLTNVFINYGYSGMYDYANLGLK